MGYVGVPPQSGFITTAKQRVTSSTNNYVDLDHSISSLADVIIWVNSIKQDSTNLTLTSSTRITLGGTLVSSDVCEVAFLGKAVATQTPSTGSVSVDMLSASGTKSSSTFLRGDNTFASAGLSNWSENSGNLLPSNASYGIYLGVNSATASNLLDDYEEGTWTPTFFDAASGGNQLSTSFAAGNYVKVGNLIRINSRATISSISGATGGNAVRMRGLPFSIYSASGNDAIGKAEIWSTGTSIDSELTALPSDAGAVAMFKFRASASTSRPSSLTVDNLSTGNVISSLTYRTA